MISIEFENVIDIINTNILSMQYQVDRLLGVSFRLTFFFLFFISRTLFNIIIYFLLLLRRLHIANCVRHNLLDIELKKKKRKRDEWIPSDYIDWIFRSTNSNLTIIVWINVVSYTTAKHFQNHQPQNNKNWQNNPEKWMLLLINNGFLAALLRAIFCWLFFFLLIRLKNGTTNVNKIA